MRTTGIGLATGIIFGWLTYAKVEISSLFIIFSLPLLVMALCIYTIPSKNVN
jgi:hypothetical protein